MASSRGPCPPLPAATGVPMSDKTHDLHDKRLADAWATLQTHSNEGLPLDRDPERGLTFDLLSSGQGPVTIGHADGVVTIDLAEGDDPHREAMRVQLEEPYRTMLGHLRHETGHYYWTRLVDGTPADQPDVTPPEALALRKEPQANVARYDGLRRPQDTGGTRHAS